MLKIIPFPVLIQKEFSSVWHFPPFRPPGTQLRWGPQGPVDIRHLQSDQQTRGRRDRVRGPRERLAEGGAFRGRGGRRRCAVGVRALRGGGQEDVGLGEQGLREEERLGHGGVAHQNQVSILIQLLIITFITCHLKFWLHCIVSLFRSCGKSEKTQTEA